MSLSSNINNIVHETHGDKREIHYIDILDYDESKLSYKTLKRKSNSPNYSEIITLALLYYKYADDVVRPLYMKTDYNELCMNKNVIEMKSEITKKILDSIGEYVAKKIDKEISCFSLVHKTYIKEKNDFVITSSSLDFNTKKYTTTTISNFSAPEYNKFITGIKQKNQIVQYIINPRVYIGKNVNYSELSVGTARVSPSIIYASIKHKNSNKKTFIEENEKSYITQEQSVNVCI